MSPVILPLPTFIHIPARLRPLTPTTHPILPICMDIPRYSGATFLLHTHTIIFKISLPSRPITFMLPSTLSHTKWNLVPYRPPLRQNLVLRSTQRKARMVGSQDHPEASYLALSISPSLRTTQPLPRPTKNSARTPRSNIQQTSLLPFRLASAQMSLGHRGLRVASHRSDRFPERFPHNLLPTMAPKMPTFPLHRRKGSMRARNQSNGNSVQLLAMISTTRDLHHHLRRHPSPH